MGEDQERKQILEKIRRLELEEEELILNDPHQMYIPIGKVEEWLDLFGSTEYFTTLLSGANGIGKTTILANIVRAIVLPTENEYFQQKLFQEFPYSVKSIRVVSNHNTLKETLIPTLKQWLPEGKYTTHKDGHQYDYRWEFESGWSLHILTYDQPIGAHESANLSLVLFDEPPPQDVYKANVARLRRGGQIGVLATLLDGSEWIYDSIIMSESDSTATVTAEVEDACEEHGVRGFLKHKDIVRMVNEYDEDDMQARIFGKPQHLTGLVFKEFDKNIHVIPPFPINRKDYVVWHSLDPHVRNPDAGVWIAIDKYNRYFVINELYDNFTTGELVRRIKHSDEDYRIAKRLIDPWVFTEDQHEGGSLSKKLQSHGLHYFAGSKRRSDATQAIKDALHYVESAGEIVSPPQIYICDTCPRTIWEVSHWKYSEWASKTQTKKAPSEKPEDKNDHCIEAMGRILLEAPQWYEEELVIPTHPARLSSFDRKLSAKDPYQ